MGEIEITRLLAPFESLEALSSWYARFIAEGAVVVARAPELPVGRAVLLEITVPDHPAVQTPAVVVGPAPEGASGVKVSVDASQGLRELLCRFALARRPGRLAGRADGRRRHERFETRLKMRFRHFPQLVDQYVTNLSRGGLFVRMDDPPEMGSLVQLEMQFPNGERREVVGEVVRVVKPADATQEGWPAGVGLQFHGESPEFFTALDQLVSSWLTRTPRVLVVEDDAFFLRVLSDGLLGSGIEVATARTGYQASRLLMDLLYDLDGVIVDLNLPGMNGYALIERLRRLATEMRLRVIVVSGASDAELEALRGSGQVDDALPKGMALGDLVARIRTHLVPKL